MLDMVRAKTKRARSRANWEFANMNLGLMGPVHLRTILSTVGCSSWFRNSSPINSRRVWVHLLQTLKNRLAWFPVISCIPESITDKMSSCFGVGLLSNQSLK
jgi:hypothetical protein